MRIESLLVRAIGSSAMQRIYSATATLPGIGSLARTIVRAWFPPGRRTWVTVTRGGAKGLELHLNLRYEAEYLSGHYEPVVESHLTGNLLPGCTFYDVGAHLGYFTLLAARLVGQTGSVFAFEPDPENAALLLEHLKRNAVPGVILVPKVVWSDCRSVLFDRACEQSGRSVGSVAAAGKVSGGREPMAVEAVTLDVFAETHPAPSLIKVDVEGAEAEVLKGADQIFRKSRPVLLCEIHDAANQEQIEKWLGERDYVFQWLEPEVIFPRHLAASPAKTRNSRMGDP